MKQVRRQTMPVVGVGVDIVELDRFNRLDRRIDRLFLNRIFTKDELAYCFGRPRPGQHLAVRFAAKEAVIKALAPFGCTIRDWRSIEVRRNSRGVPQLSLPKNLKLTSSISISHNAFSGVAFVLLYSNG